MNAMAMPFHWIAIIVRTRVKLRGLVYALHEISDNLARKCRFFPSRQHMP